MTAYPASFVMYFRALPVTLTSLRKAVLFVLWEAKKPLKVYEILESLNKAQCSATATSVYRTLDFFIGAGLLRKIESIQAYVLCLTSHTDTKILMVCNRCHDIAETHDEALHFLLAELASRVSFQMGGEMIEIKGICSTCHLNQP